MTEQNWAGITAHQPGLGAPIQLLAIVQPGVGSAASPFLGKCNDGGNWWIKPPVAGMTKALVSEWVVGRLGAAIGAPVCEVSLVTIGHDLLPCDFAPGRPLNAGTGCGSRDLAGTPTEIRGQLQHRDDDDNRRRHAGVFALVDWFFGEDLQWLHDTADDWTLYSHDHGWYLPPGGADWSPDQLRATVATPLQPFGDSVGLDITELHRLASALDSLPDQAIATVLRAVPRDWSVPAADLDCLGWYLAERRATVASRLRTINAVGATA